MQQPVKYPCLGKNIRSLRKRRGVTQRQLAEVLGVTNKAVSAWEVSYADPRRTVINKLSEYFGIAPDLLCFHRLLSTSSEDSVQEEMLFSSPDPETGLPFGMEKNQPSPADLTTDEDSGARTEKTAHRAVQTPSAPPAQKPSVKTVELPGEPAPSYVFAAPGRPQIVVQEPQMSFRSETPHPLPYSPVDYFSQIAQLMQDMNEENKKKLLEKARLLLKLQMLEEFDKN